MRDKSEPDADVLASNLRDEQAFSSALKEDNRRLKNELASAIERALRAESEIARLTGIPRDH